MNGENLTDKSNADAMEALRLAMQKEGNETGFIRVLIGRRPGLAVVTPSTPTTPRELRISMADPADSHNDTFIPPTAAAGGLPPSGAGGDGARTDASQPKAAHKPSDTNRLRNPVLDRVSARTGAESGSGEGDAGGIRNLSYMRATHDSMLDSFADSASPAKSEKDVATPPTTIIKKTIVPKPATSSSSTAPPLTSTPTASALNSFGSSAKLAPSSSQQGVMTTGDVIRIDETTTYQVKMVYTLKAQGQPVLLLDVHF